MKKILFSPIGGTDPISNFRDGAMLHGEVRITRAAVLLTEESWEEWKNLQDL